MANELATTNKPKAPITIKDYMSAPAVQNKLKEMFVTPEAIRNFSTAVISICSSDELLNVAEPRSAFNACLTAASLNLPINKNLGFAHILGFRNNKKGIVEAQFLIGARGFKELAIRTGQYKFINQGDIREGELAGRNRLTGEIDFNWNEDEAERLTMPIVGYFSYFQLQNGFSSTYYMSKEQVEAHASRYSQSYKTDLQKGWTSSPWSKDFGSMALKTVSKLNISKNGPLSIDMQKAIAVDQAVIHDDNKIEYIDGDELMNVGADEDKKAAIIAANQEEGDAAEVTQEDLDNLEAAGAQATLIDETKKSDNYGDNPQRRSTGKR